MFRPVRTGMASELTDSDQLGRAIAGDADALQAVLAAHQSRLLAYVRVYMPEELRPILDPADVVQDTLFAACRRVSTYQHRSDDGLFAWLASIARHTLIDLLRRHRTAKRGGEVPLSANESQVLTRLQQVASQRRTPSRSAEAHEAVAELERAILRLPEDYRNVVTLRHLEGLSIAETAQRMQRSSGAVAMLTNRALECIRQDLMQAESVS